MVGGIETAAAGFAALLLLEESGGDGGAGVAGEGVAADLLGRGGEDEQERGILRMMRKGRENGFVASEVERRDRIVECGREQIQHGEGGAQNVALRD